MEASNMIKLNKNLIDKNYSSSKITSEFKKNVK